MFEEQEPSGATVASRAANVAILVIAALLSGCETMDLQQSLSQLSQGLNNISSTLMKDVGQKRGQSNSVQQQAQPAGQQHSTSPVQTRNARKNYADAAPAPQHSSSSLSASSTSENDGSMAYGEVVETDIEHQTAITVGTAKTQEEARKIALKTAVEEVVGFYMDANVSMVNDDIQQRVNTVSNGSVTNCEVLAQGPTKDGLYQMKIKAVVKKEDVQAAFKNVSGFSTEQKATSLRDRQAEILSRQIKNTDQGKMLADFLDGMDPIHQWMKVSDVSYEVSKSVPVEHSHELQKLRLADLDYSILSVTYTLACSQMDYMNNFEGHFAKILANVSSGNAKPKASMPGCVAGKTTPTLLMKMKAPITARVDGRDDDAEILTKITYPRHFGIPDFPTVGEEWSVDFEIDEYGHGEYRKPHNVKFRSEISLVTKCNEDFSVFQITSFPVSEKVYGRYRDWYRKVMSDSYVANIFLQDENGKDVMAMSDTIPGLWLFRDSTAYSRDDGRSQEFLKNFVFGPIFEVSGQLNNSYADRIEKCDYIFSPAMTRTVYFKVPNDKLGSISKVAVEIP